MKRALMLLALTAGLGLAVAVPATAQTPITFAFGATPADTGSGLVPGAAPTTIPIRSHFPAAATSVYSYGYAVQTMQLTVHFDPALVEVLGAGSGTYGLSVTGSLSGTGAYTVTASYSGYYAGVYGVDAVPLQITARLLPGAPNGAFLWIEPGPATACYQNYYFYSCTGSYALQGRGQIGQFCHATAVWGDVDGNHQVESRDALITLSAAVGLTVSGTFDLAMGDVDGDGLTNSRDALMMLSYAVGLATDGSGPLDRVAVGIADACPGLTPPGETVVYHHSAAGIFRLDSLSTTPVELTSVAVDDWPKLNAAGTSVAFSCPDSTFNLQICVVGADGTGRRMLTAPGLPFRMRPDWSPDGTRIAYLQNGADSLYTMDSSGTGQTALPASGAEAAWSRDGTRLLFGSGGLFTITVDSAPTGFTIIPSLDVQPPVRWSPDGSSVAFLRTDGRIWTVPSGGGTYLPLTWFAQPINTFDWGPQGIIFSMPDPHGVPSLWLLQGGPGGPLVRLTNPGSGQSDSEPSFRRNP